MNKLKKLEQIFSRIVNAPGELRKTVTEKRTHKLNADLATAVFWDDATEVARLLRRGADPNARWDRSHPLDVAARRAGLAVIDTLLLAGADPLEPHRWAGHEMRLSDLAREWKRPREIVDRIEQAERAAEAIHGPRPLRAYQRYCIRKSQF